MQSADGARLLADRQRLLRKSLAVSVANDAQKQAFVTATYTTVTKPGWWSCDFKDELILSCDAGDPQAKRVIVIIGDSYTEMWSSAFRQLTRELPDVRAHLFSVGNCGNSLNVTGMFKETVSANGKGAASQQTRRKQCALMHKLALDYIKTNRPEQVVFSSHVAGVDTANLVAYVNGAHSFFRQAGKYSGNVTLLGAVPNYPDPKECFNRDVTNVNQCDIGTSGNISADRVQRELLSGADINLVDTLPWFCVDGQCPIFLGDTIAAAAPFHISRDVALLTAPLLYDALFGNK